MNWPLLLARALPWVCLAVVLLEALYLWRNERRRGWSMRWFVFVARAYLVSVMVLLILDPVPVSQRGLLVLLGLAGRAGVDILAMWARRGRGD